MWDPVTHLLAQMGWGDKTPNYTRYNFAEVAKGTTTLFGPKEFAADSIGSYVNYKVTYGGGAYHFFKNDTNYYTYTTSDDGCWAQQFGETQDYNSQMPGVTSDNEIYVNPSVLINGTWSSPSTWVHGQANYGGLTYYKTPSTFTSGPGSDPYTPSIQGSPGYPFENSYIGGTDPQLNFWDLCN
jgi:hypothetical protein